jgi:hypothetical protein
MHEVKYSYGQVDKETAPERSAESSRWGAPPGWLEYVLGLNAALTAVSFMLILLSYL